MTSVSLTTDALFAVAIAKRLMRSGEKENEAVRNQIGVFFEGHGEVSSKSLIVIGDQRYWNASFSEAIRSFDKVHLWPSRVWALSDFEWEYVRWTDCNYRLITFSILDETENGMHFLCEVENERRFW